MIVFHTRSFGRLLVVQVGPRRDDDGVRPVDREALEADEVVHLVLHDRAADGAAPALVAGVRLGQVVLLGEEVLGRQAAVLEEAERAAADAVGAGLGHRVDHRAGRAAELARRTGR